MSMTTDKRAFITHVPVWLAIVTFGFGVWQYAAAQSWKRSEFVASEMKAFRAHPSVQLTLELLDWNDARYVLVPGSADTVQLNDEMVALALRTHIQAPAGFTEQERVLRRHFDLLFDELERFNHYVEAGLVRDSDLRPYLDYYLRIVGDSSSGRTDPAFLRAVWNYLDCYDFDGARALMQRRGYVVAANSGCRSEPVSQAGMRR